MQILFLRYCRRQIALVIRMLSVGDNIEEIKSALEFLLRDADVVVVTGGLGPTTDDITTTAIAHTFDKQLHTDNAVLLQIKGIFEKYRIQWTDNNTKQAVFPLGAIPIVNHAGTAWGYSLEIGKKLIVVIPGPPKEASAMLRDSIIPLLCQRDETKQQTFRATVVVKVFGISESKIDKLIADSGLHALGVDVGFYPNFYEVLVTVNTYQANEQQAQKIIAQAKKILENQLGEHIFSFSYEALEATVARELMAQQLTISVAESCSGGLIADRLTDVSGSSAYFHNGIVCYSNESKTKLLGVPDEVIKEYGAVSKEVALLMAQGAKKVGGTDIGLATTGIAGPTGGSAEKPVGTVFIALAHDAGSFCQHFSFRWDRRRNKMITSQTALVMLLKRLQNKNLCCITHYFQ